MNFISDPYASYVIVNFLLVGLSTWGLLVTGAVFLAQALDANRRLAGWINGAIVTSFLFANVGYAFIDSSNKMRNTFLENLGSSMLFLGFTLFLGIWVFSRMRHLSAAASSPDRYVERSAR